MSLTLVVMLGLVFALFFIMCFAFFYLWRMLKEYDALVGRMEDLESQFSVAQCVFDLSQKRLLMIRHIAADALPTNPPPQLFDFRRVLDALTKIHRIAQCDGEEKE